MLAFFRSNVTPEPLFRRIDASTKWLVDEIVYRRNGQSAKWFSTKRRTPPPPPPQKKKKNLPLERGLSWFSSNIHL